MKKFFLFVLISLVALASNAQTIHWLTFIDTKDPNVGSLDITGRNVLYNHFVHVVNAALTEKGYNSVIHDIYGTELSPQRCIKEVKDLKCKPEDIIVFYYIGHGTHAIGEDNPYPQMLLGSTNEEEFVPLKWVHNELSSKGGRLTVSIGMCCNVLQPVTPKSAPNYAVNYGNISLTDTERDAIQRMFLSYKGNFLLSSASVGQSSLGGPTPLGDMDLFTAVMVSFFEDMAYDGALDWNDLFTEVRNVVHNVTGGRQTPFWENNLSPAKIVDSKKTEEPNTKSAESKGSNNENTVTSSKKSSTLNLDDSNAVSNYLSDFFDYIIDTRNKFGDRVNKAEELKNLFSNGAVVRMLPQDGNTIIDRENIESFLGRISTSRLIIKIAPIQYKHNGTKITELRVKEMYLKD